MKPLYLDGASPMRVELDGPALRVERSLHAVVLVPLSRVSRVVVSGDVSWCTPAMLACADSGIPIIFVNSVGAVRARWNGKVNSRCTLKRYIEGSLDRPDWEERYATWIDAVERQAALRIAGRLHVAVQLPLFPAEVKLALSDKAAGFTDAETWRHMTEVQYGLLRVHVCALLTKKGLRGDAGPVVRGALDLETDITRVLDWDLELLRWGWLRRRRIWQRKTRRGLDTPGRREIVKLYESRATRVERSCEVLLGRMHRWLSEIV